MDTKWHWPKGPGKYLNKVKRLNYFKKEGKVYEVFRIWWTICTTRIKRKIK